MSEWAGELLSEGKVYIIEMARIKKSLSLLSQSLLLISEEGVAVDCNRVVADPVGPLLLQELHLPHHPGRVACLNQTKCCLNDLQMRMMQQL